MRPRGEIRELLVSAVTTLCAERGPVTGREVAAFTQVGFEVARYTLDNAVDAGELRIAGKDKPAGSRHWCNLYEPVDDDTPQPWAGIEALVSVMRSVTTPPDPAS